MRVRRDVSSVPYRSASETWLEIVHFVTGPDSRDVQQLKDAGGVLASIITDKHPEARAIVIEGTGPQLRVYCRYGMDAVEEGGKIDPLTWNPTAGDWTVHVPCDAENIEWVKTSLAKSSPRFRVFDVEEADCYEDEGTDGTAKGGGDVVVDWNVKG